MSNDLWRTPNTNEHPIIDLCNKTFSCGYIDLDPVSDLNKSVKAKQHYTEEDNCLRLDWLAETVFMNPPFSNPLPFVKKLVEQHQYKANVYEAIGLFKIGVLANKGTGSVIRNSAKSICIWGAGKSSRIAFLNQDGEPIKGADFDCCLIYWGYNAINFDYTFSKYGTILRTL